MEVKRNNQGGSKGARSEREDTVRLWNSLLELPVVQAQVIVGLYGFNRRRRTLTEHEVARRLKISVVAVRRHHDDARTKLGAKFLDEQVAR